MQPQLNHSVQHSNSLLAKFEFCFIKRYSKDTPVVYTCTCTIRKMNGYHVILLLFLKMGFVRAGSVNNTTNS